MNLDRYIFEFLWILSQVKPHPFSQVLYFLKFVRNCFLWLTLNVLSDISVNFYFSINLYERQLLCRRHLCLYYFSSQPLKALKIDKIWKSSFLRVSRVWRETLRGAKGSSAPDQLFWDTSQHKTLTHGSGQILPLFNSQ